MLGSDRHRLWRRLARKCCRVMGVDGLQRRPHRQERPAFAVMVGHARVTPSRAALSLARAMPSRRLRCVRPTLRCVRPGMGDITALLQQGPCGRRTRPWPAVQSLVAGAAPRRPCAPGQWPARLPRRPARGARLAATARADPTNVGAARCLESGVSIVKGGTESLCSAFYKGTPPCPGSHRPPTRRRGPPFGGAAQARRAAAVIKPRSRLSSPVPRTPP